ncbi:DsrE family protein [Pricia sp. S334]|uniref:DsrE family protein n=1 Tax=Pricia mediterranea TaxID=3076079 RepID=A0ABU3L274_9FLAO|nr:DsrE family protein [Pricia sp. S334]MDT7827363.1 DsrE family protein [Pricia sp. S334]
MKTFIAFCSLLSIAASASAQEWINPVIKDYGKIKFYKNAELVPDKNTEYKMVFDLTLDSQGDSINKGLNKIARAINLLGASGVPKEKMYLVGIIHSNTTSVILSNEAHRKRTGKDNPNMDLLKVLTENGVKFYVCGQSLAHRGIDIAEMNPYIDLSLSAMTSLTYFQYRGYALMP